MLNCKVAVDTREIQAQARNRTFSDHHQHLSTNTSVYTRKGDKMIVQGAELGSMGMCFENTPTPHTVMALKNFLIFSLVLNSWKERLFLGKPAL